MEQAPGIVDYLQSPYIIEVVVVLLLGWFLRSPWRLARHASWRSLSGWRRLSLVIGWFCFLLAVAAWLFLLYVSVSALHTSLDPTVPKPFSLIFVLIGGFAYLLIIGFAGLALDAAVRSVRDDIRQMTGRDS